MYIKKRAGSLDKLNVIEKRRARFAPGSRSRGGLMETIVFWPSMAGILYAALLTIVWWILLADVGDDGR
jgi:hypothetical protein